jgi:CPA1 family monovalent cation:H+ antiporter
MPFKIDLIFGLLVAVAAMALLARKISVPYPILLVVGGLVLALFSSKLHFHLEPDLVFLIFLPPLLYPAALMTSWRDFRANLRPIMLLAFGLVLFTTCSVGYLAQYIIPAMPLAGAFILGAIISPPDAVAATAITERLRVPQRIVTIIEGESLVNDATALVAFAFAVDAFNTGSFSLAHAGLRFVIVSLGGVLIGLAVGWIASQVQRRLDDPPVQITISILTPYAAFLGATRLDVSGVLAVVTAGLFLGWRSPEIINSRMRLQAYPVWEMITFLLNGVVFILIGLQLPEVLKVLSTKSLPVTHLISRGALISALVIVVRFIWVFTATYVPRWLSKSLRQRDPIPDWRHVTIVAWTGMRGVVSLAAAMALPSMIIDDPVGGGRDVTISLVIFFTFAVILATLVLQGLTLPLLIRALNVVDSGETEREERDARLKANLAAMARLVELEQKKKFSPELLQHLRVEYEDRVRQLETLGDADSSSTRQLFSKEYDQLQHNALQVERHTILQLRNERAINDHALRRIQRDLDLAEARLHE